MISLLLFLHSPLARHPALLLRKIGTRLGLRPERLAPLHAPVRDVEYPAHWPDAFGNDHAFARVPTAGAPIGPQPFTRIFGHEFSEDELLHLCRTGPRLGERGLAGDIKLIWDYSRGHPLWPNAVLGYHEENAAFIRRWSQAASDVNGPAWSCAMDVAIRAVNWAFSDAVARGEIRSRIGAAEWAQWLWRHGHVIWHRLEARTICSNHYLANLLGLAVLGSVFPGDSAARRWRNFARAEFPRALLNQTRPDGGLNEASLRYHAFVTEMALLTRLALGAPFPARAETRLRQMCQVVADFQDATGDLVALGDDDSGCVLPLDWTKSAGRAGALLRLAEAELQCSFSPAADALYSASGWWVRRAGEFGLAFEFGGVGLHGLGAHAHNDDFSFNLDWRGHPVIVDPGTFLYTSDLEARNRFRSVLAHNTVSVDGQEPHPLDCGAFLLPGSDAAAAAVDAISGGKEFTRALGGNAFHTRRVQMDKTGLSLEDVIRGTGCPRIEWRFHVHPAVAVRQTDESVTLGLPAGGQLHLDSSGGPVRLTIESTEYSGGYGRAEPAQVCLARVEACPLPVSRRWTIRPG